MIALDLRNPRNRTSGVAIIEIELHKRYPEKLIPRLIHWHSDIATIFNDDSHPSESDYGELSQVSANLSHHALISAKEAEIRRELPARLGSGYPRCLQLSSGIWLDLFDQDFAQHWTLKVSEHEHLVQFTIMLSGVVDYEDTYPRLGGEKGYLSGSGVSPGYTAHYGRSRPLKGVNIHLKPEGLQPFLADQPLALQRSLLKTDDWKTAWFPQVTPAMQTVAQQMMQGAFQGGNPTPVLAGQSV